MKQNKNLFSSFLVALIAGFIYYQLGGVEDIKKIASFGFQMISNPIEEVTSTKVAVNGKLINVNITKKGNNNEVLASVENETAFKQSTKELAVIDPIALYFSAIPDDLYKINISTDENTYLTNEGKFIVNTEYYIPKIYNMNKKDLKSIRTRDYDKYVNVVASVDDLYEDYMPVKISDDDDQIIIISDDSNFIKLDIEKLELDNFNIKLDSAMVKLNIAISKLTDNLKDMDFDFENEENKEEFKLQMKEFEADMKEFEKEMKKLDIDEDMKEFKLDMKEFKEDMKKYKEEMKEHNRELKENLKEQKRERYIEKDIDS